MQLECSGLGVSLGGKNILNDVDANFGTHRFVGVIGPNGSGKSTLLRTFYKALKPRTGCVLIDGRNLKDVSHRTCAGLLAVLPQHQRADLDLTVEEAIYMGSYQRDKFFVNRREQERQKVEQILKELHFTAFSKRKLSTLSGGERQMAGLARALMQDTPCLLLDEPTNHLDINHQFKILEILGKVDRQLIVVFHDLSLASKFCDYLYIMKEGTIFAEGTPLETINKRIIQEVYNVEVEIITHPKNGHPVVLF